MAYPAEIDPLAAPDGYVVVVTDGWTNERTLAEPSLYDDHEDARTLAADAQRNLDDEGRNAWSAVAAVYLLDGKP